MGKYDQLRDHLAAHAGGDAVRLTFNEVASLTGALPVSAWQQRSWWQQDVAASLGGGWRIADLDQREEWVEFALADG